MKTKFSGILTLFLAFLVQMTFAQERTISGVVSDENGLPLPAATVLVKGTSNGTSTDFDGNYLITTTQGETLVYSYVGYKNQEIAVGSANVINVSLVSDNTLDEVVIEAAYDIRKAKPLTNTSVSAVSSETIESRPNTSLVQTLQGQTPGLNITTASGQPGANSNILIRGIGSIGGSTEPLFVIDGTPADQSVFRNINPNDIESVSVLKDAGATAVYGNRGTNGVIIIKTKSAKFNSGVTINYTHLTSLADLQKTNYDLLSSKEQLELERRFGNGDGVGLTDAELAEKAKVNTNWNDEFFRQALTQSHTLSIASGGENVRNFTSLGFTDQQGILKRSGLQRFNIRNNLNGKTKNEKFSYGSNISLGYVKNNIVTAIGSGIVNQNFIIGAFRGLPYLDTDLYVPGQGGNIAGVFRNTPYFLLDRLDQFTNTQDEFTLIAGLNGSYKLNDYLTLNSRFNVNYSHVSFLQSRTPQSFTERFFAEENPATDEVNETPGYQTQQSTRDLTLNTVNSINFAKTYNENHTFELGLYSEFFKAHLRSFGVRADGLYIQNFSPGTGAYVPDNALNDWHIDVGNASRIDSGLFSYFATFDYDFKRKYGFGAVIRRDASSRFKDDNLWGTFGSVSARWNIDQEDFMSDSAFNLLKLRASYGTTGNQQIVGTSNYSGVNLNENLYAIGASYGGTDGLAFAQLANEDLRWETTAQANIGLDFSVWSSKLTGSIDVYRRETTDLFTSQPVQSAAGIAARRENRGEIVNKGFEANAAYKLFTENENLSLTVNGNVSFNDARRYGANNSAIEEGGKLNQYYLIDYAGVNPGNGNLLYKDINGNLTDNPNVNTDRRFTNKNRLPDFQGAFGFNLNYKGFFLDTQFNYAIGIDRFDFDYADLIRANAIGDFRGSRDLLKAWTPSNTNTNIPSLTATNLETIDGGESTRFLQNADYLRLRFVSLGYNFDKNTIKRLGISKLRLFLNGENLLTFSKWNGYDVEGLSSTQASYPTPRIFAAGLELGF